MVKCVGTRTTSMPELLMVVAKIGGKSIYGLSIRFWTNNAKYAQTHYTNKLKTMADEEVVRPTDYMIHISASRLQQEPPQSPLINAGGVLRMTNVIAQKKTAHTLPFPSDRSRR